MSMKKTAVALGLMAALGAHAEVTLYGVLDLNLSSVKAVGADKRVTGIENGGMTASFIGLSGEEDLGNGLKASFQLESLLKADTGASNATSFWGRNANIALSGDFGKVTVGRKQKIYYDAVAAFNPFGSSGMGASMSLMNDLLPSGAVTSLDPDTLTAETRAWSNSITYESPDMAGLSGAVQISLKEAADAGNNVAVSGQYVAGPFAVGVAYQQTKLGLFDDNDQKDTRMVLGAFYDLGMAKVFGQFSKGSVKDLTTGDTTVKTDTFQLGATVPVTEESSVMATVGQLKVKDSDPATKRTIYSLGYDQNLSKRTDVYGVVRSDKITNQTKGSAIAVGVRHRF